MRSEQRIANSSGLLAASYSLLAKRKGDDTMKKLMMLMLGMAAVALLSAPPVAQAQLGEAISLTNQGVEALTDWPALGGRHKVELDKIAGADFRQYKKAGALFQDALAKAKAGNASRMAIFKLEEAVIRVPKFGSYTSP